MHAVRHGSVKEPLTCDGVRGGRMEGLPKHLVTGLTAHKEVHEEIEAFLAAIAAKGGVRSDL